MTVAFPIALPSPMAAQFSHSEMARWRRNDTQSGPPRYTKLTEKKPVMFNVSWFFTAIELQLFEAWFKSRTVYGSIPFTIDLPVCGESREHECYFDAPYSVTARAGANRWVVSAVLLAVGKVYDTDEDSLDLAAFGELFAYGEFVEGTDAFNTFAEVTLGDEWYDLLA